MNTHRPLFRLYVLIAIVLGFVATTGAQPHEALALQGATASVYIQDDQAPRKTPLHELVEAAVQFSNVYDSNIDHNEDYTRSYGYVPSLRVRLVSRLDDPLFTFDYVVARHAYSNTQRWDRVSNLFSLAYAPEVSDQLHLTTIAEVSLKGSSEDRDLSNQFQLVQEIEYRLTREHRVILYGTYRLKRFPESPEDNAFKPNAGLIFQRRMDEGERVAFEARYERNIEELAEEGYSRWTYSAEYRTPISRRGTQLQLQAKYRSKLYDEELVELDDVDYLRHDQQWSMEVELNQRIARSLNLTLGYEHEFRNSNDPEKYFDANLLLLMLSYRI